MLDIAAVVLTMVCFFALDLYIRGCERV